MTKNLESTKDWTLDLGSYLLSVSEGVIRQTGRQESIEHYGENIMKPSLSRLSALRGKFGFLSRISVRWRLAILYVLLIFGFACVYSLLHTDFYNANANREPMVYDMVRESEERISRELGAEIVSTFEKNYGSNQKVIDNWSIDGSTFRVMFLKATQRGTAVEISFKLDMKLNEISDRRRTLYIDPVVTFPAREGSENTLGTDVRYKTVKVDVPAVPFWDKAESYRFAKAFFPTESVRRTQIKGDASREDTSASLPEMTMPISKHLDAAILELERVIQGDLSKVGADFWRMVYLSAVTITTLGYGDLTPLTTPTRLLLSSEAVLGIVIIGSFINAGSKRRNKRKTPKSKSVVPVSETDLPESSS